MSPVIPHIDRYLFARHFDAFRGFVESKSKHASVSFRSNQYLLKEENYKYIAYEEGRKCLAADTWNSRRIGKGVIRDAVRNAIEVPDNNLISWQLRGLDVSSLRQNLYDVADNTEALRRVEKALFALYRHDDDQQSFTELVEIFGRQYPVLGYLFYLKDRTQYLPIAPTYFDRSFAYLGADFRTKFRCSWENYIIYLELIHELQELLSESMCDEVTLLDAHSFAWMLSDQMKKARHLPDVKEYFAIIKRPEREVISKARLGQGPWRDELIDYWTTCAVTRCQNKALLRASHIKPWAQSLPDECLDLYNGLLLSPALDTCFDQGYISFENDGRIKVSPKLSVADTEALGISPEMRLSQIDGRHCKYLEYHRKYVFLYC